MSPRGLSLVHAVREPLEAQREPSPVLLLLHGVGSNEQDLMGLAPALDPRLFIVSARAPITLDFGSYGWYHVEFTPEGPVINEKEAEESRKRIIDFAAELAESYNVDPDCVLLMGFSQGCILALAAALTEPRRFRGVVGMSGRLLPGIESKAAPPEDLKEFPILIVHGSHDNVLPIEYGREIRRYLETLPVALEYREYPMGHHVSPESMADVQRWLSDTIDACSDTRS